MFDTYLSGPGYRGPSSVNVSVTEKRAPTDESVRLLNEMQKKAEANLLAALHLDNNELKGMVHIYQDVLRASKNVVVVFELNGKQVRHESKIKEWVPKDEIPGILVKELSQTIACELLSNVITGNLHYELMR
jgi:hypothetical protein